MKRSIKLLQHLSPRPKICIRWAVDARAASPILWKRASAHAQNASQSPVDKDGGAQEGDRNYVIVYSHEGSRMFIPWGSPQWPAALEFEQRPWRAESDIFRSRFGWASLYSLSYCSGAPRWQKITG